MSSDLRKILNIINESTTPMREAPEKAPIQKDVKNSLNVLSRQYGQKGRYVINAGYKNLDGVLKSLRQFVSKYTIATKKDVSNLVTAFRGLQKNDRLTDKEHYLRQGFESIGFTSPEITLVWFKDDDEYLYIFAKNNETVMDIRDFFQYFKVIK